MNRNALLPLDLLDSAHLLRACAPIGEGQGHAFAESALIGPLAAAFGCYDVRTDIAIRGVFGGDTWTARSGHLFGRFGAPLFGIPASGRLAWLRFGCFQRFDGEAPTETIVLLDLPSLMLQSGVWPFAGPLGPDLMAPAPLAANGDSAASLALVEAMISGLMRYDGKTLSSMTMRDFWTKDFNWYGPAPIGSFRGHHDYERGHQRPFLSAFPDRKGGNHRARIGEGAFVASTGWPSIRATHSGGDWLGLAATNAAVTMRVMDFWACRDGRLSENWVMIDIPHLFLQLGIDIFDRMRNLTDRS